MRRENEEGKIRPSERCVTAHPWTPSIEAVLGSRKELRGMLNAAECKVVMGAPPGRTQREECLHIL